MKSFNHQFEASLSAAHLQILRNIGETAAERGEAVYLVGGVVRDIFLRRSSYDLDMVIEGRAISLARQIAKVNDCSLKTHPRFGTAKILFGNLNLDLVTARSESYVQPGALPTVKAGTIQDDLARRDFTINAMAIRLAPDSFGELLDPHGGQQDIKQKSIRILHPKSFEDDPTRILRAVRYEQRLDFQLEKTTEKLLQHNLEGLDTVTGERLWHELELILNEERPEKSLLRADKLGVLRKLYPPLKGDNWLAEKSAQARNLNKEASSLPAIYLAIMIYRFDLEEAEDCINRFRMPRWAARTVRDTMRLKNSLSSLEASDLRPSHIYRKLESHIPEVIKGIALVSDSPIIQQRIELYLQNLRYIKPEISGNDLQNMGVSPGKKIGQILRTLQEARIDNTVSSYEEEETLVQSLL